MIRRFPAVVLLLLLGALMLPGVVVAEHNQEDSVVKRVNADGEVFQTGIVVTVEPSQIEPGTQDATVVGDIETQIPAASDNVVFGVVGTSEGRILDVKPMSSPGSGSISHRFSVPQDAEGELVWTFHAVPNPQKAGQEFKEDARNGFVGDAGETQAIVIADFGAGTAGHGSDASPIGEGLPGLTASLAALSVLVAGLIAMRS